MVDRRSGAVVLALVAFVFLIVAHADAGTLWSFGKHDSWAREGYTSPHRLGGSEFSPTGDPDEIATVRPRDSGRLNGDIVDPYESIIFRDVWATGLAGSHSALFHYLAHLLQVAW